MLRVTRDLRVVDDLIEESRTNLARGYAIEERTDYRPQWVNCGPPVVIERDGKRRVRHINRCFEQVPYTSRHPVAIDLGDEQRKLDQLILKRRQLARAARPAVDQCRAQFPE